MYVITCKLRLPGAILEAGLHFQTNIVYRKLVIAGTSY